MTAEIVTIKPRTAQELTGTIEYQVLGDVGEILSHGHQIPLPADAGASTTLAEATGLVYQDCYVKGHIEPPADWVAPAVEVDPDAAPDPSDAVMVAAIEVSS